MRMVENSNKQNSLSLSALRHVGLITFMLMQCLTAVAQTSTHPWVAQMPDQGSGAEFTNLRNGDVVGKPFVAKFGMSNWGIAPAGNAIAFTGHHHLLVNTPLPTTISTPLPFNKNYMHFGKGQMEAIVDLPVGEHTLRLLLADHKHAPYYVYSKQITVTVSDKGPPLPVKYGKTPALEILTPEDGAKLRKIALIKLHASGLNISHASPKLKDTGYFVLQIQAENANRTKSEQISLLGGQTEVWLEPPAGNYRLTLRYARPDGTLIPEKSKPISLRFQ
jgi:Domain of unknown function (DUF4399)